MAKQSRRNSGFYDFVNDSADVASTPVTSMDIDIVWSQFRESTDNTGTRDILNLMLIENRAQRAAPSEAQTGTISMLNQLLLIGAEKTVKLYDVDHKQCKVKYWGAHILRYAGKRPDQSEWIEWDARVITLEQLKSVLRYDTRPDTLKPNDKRTNHSAAELTGLLFGKDSR